MTPNDIAIIALWVSGGSLLVSFTSLFLTDWQARRVEEHARQAVQQAGCDAIAPISGYK